MQVVTEVEKQNLDNFIPLWTEIINQLQGKGLMERRVLLKQIKTEKGLSYEDSKHCLVSEAFLFKRDYDCDKCSRLAVAPAYNAVFTDGYLEPFKQTLYEHMKEAHWKC